MNATIEEYGCKINWEGESGGMDAGVALELCIILRDESKLSILLSILFQTMISQCMLI